MSGEVAPLRAYLRELQRRHQVAVAVVHHARKGAGHARAGQALRGSSEFHAWGDSNLYLRRAGDALTLTVEHRAAAAVADLPVALVADGEALALRVLDHAPAAERTPPCPSAADRVTQALAAAPAPLTVAELRQACRMRTATLCAILADLVRDGRVGRTAAGYVVAAP